MSDIVIEATTPGGSPVDISAYVIFGSSSFNGQLSAVPGLAEFDITDPNRELPYFDIGSEITMAIDGIRQWGGYLRTRGDGYAFPADDTSDPGTYVNAITHFACVDYNILFDQRVLRNTSNYRKSPPFIEGSTMDGDAIQYALAHYFDIPGDFGIGASFIDNITTVSADGTTAWAYPQQGTRLRDMFDQMSLRSAASYYIDANKNFHYHSIESTEARWGFSDVPNNAPITLSPDSFQDAFYGFREVDGTEDGSQLVNDALIWGGSEWAGPEGGTLFKRVEDTASEALHGRWQVGEVHLGEEGFGIQAGVDARANAIVLGPPGADAYGQTKGLRYSQWQFHFAWHDTNVPDISGDKDHLRAGQLVNIDLQVFGVTKLLPLRSLTITFPTAKDTGETYVRFEGDFGVQLSDPFTLWAALLKREHARILTILPPAPISTATPSSTTVTYGSLGQFLLTPTPDGSEVNFFYPFPYVRNTTQVYVDPDGAGGILVALGTDYTESDPDHGEVTFVSPPTGTRVLGIARTGSAPVSSPTTGGTEVPATDGALASAVSAASPGDVLLLRGGDHNVDDIIYVDKELTLTNYGTERPNITHPTLRPEFIFITGGPVLLNGLVFTGVGGYGDVHGSALVAIEADGHDVTIQNCEFHGASDMGATQQLVYFHDTAGNNASIQNCLVDGHGSGGFGVHLYPGPGPNNVLVSGNVIRGFPDKAGALCWTDSGGIRIVNNAFSNCASAIRHHNSNGTYVDGNVGDGGLGQGLEVDDSTNLTIGVNNWGV